MSTAMQRAYLLLLSVWLAATTALAGGPGEHTVQTVTATLNGLEITFDRQTGSIVRLKHAGPGVILETTVEAATLLDLAYPVPQFEPLRLASRFSTGAKIVKTDGQVTVRWDKLGASRSFVQVPGRVSATVTLKAAPDGTSVIMTCQVENHSDNAVRQVLFPDMLGLLPFAGAADTEFRIGDRVIKPFVSLAKPAGDQFYAVNSTFAEFKSSGKESTGPGRSLLLGSQKSGFGLFPVRAVWDTGPIVFLQMWERIGKLRLMCNHYVDLGKGAKWESDEYWLTPYKQGRAEATETYQSWLKKQGVGHE
jgi:hypothetical protein